jgi:hypothetical protein
MSVSTKSTVSTPHDVTDPFVEGGFIASRKADVTLPIGKEGLEYHAEDADIVELRDGCLKVGTENGFARVKACRNRSNSVSSAHRSRCVDTVVVVRVDGGLWSSGGRFTRTCRIGIEHRLGHGVSVSHRESTHRPVLQHVVVDLDVAIIWVVVFEVVEPRDVRSTNTKLAFDRTID